MRRITLAVLAAVALVPGFARADATAQFPVVATVKNYCTITAPTSVTFTGWDMSASVSQPGTMTVACTKGASYDMTLASQNGWQLKNASDSVGIDYVIYQPNASGAADTKTQWNTANKYTYTSTTRNAKDLVFTTTLQPSDVAAGTYSDTVTATIAF